MRSNGRPNHVAVIMDGNGRWATRRGRPRLAGHLAGAKAVRRTVEFARRRGIPVLTLYAFSSDNWSRPQEEVQALMTLFRRHLAAEVPRLAEHGIRLSVIGRRDRLAPDLVEAIAAAEDATAGGSEMRLRLAIDYSARDQIVRAAARLQSPRATREHFVHALAEAGHDPLGVPDVDLLIRTGGEQRLSDFLLWECAYAELVFSRRMWPEFGDAEFEAAIEEFNGRQRRFGGVPAAAAG